MCISKTKFFDLYRIMIHVMNLTSDIGGKSMYQKAETCEPTRHFLEDWGKCKRTCVVWQATETSG
jgi:hypothetical protein